MRILMLSLPSAFIVSLRFVSSELIFWIDIFQFVSSFDLFLMIALPTRGEIALLLGRNSCKGGEIHICTCLWLWHVFGGSLWDFECLFCSCGRLWALWDFVCLFCSLCWLCWAFTSWFELSICTWLLLNPFFLFSWKIMCFCLGALSCLPYLWGLRLLISSDCWGCHLWPSRQRHIFEEQGWLW